MTRKGFTQPKLYDGKGDLKKEWFVGFRFTDPVTQIRKPFQLRMGINYYKTKSERYAEAKLVIASISDKLAKGWNPHNEKIERFMAKQIQENNKDFFINALTIAFEKKTEGATIRTKQAYQTHYRAAVEAATTLHLVDIPVNNITRGDIKKMLDEIRSQRQNQYDKEGKGKMFTGNTYNKYLRFISSLFTEIYERYDIDADNPCSKISKKKEIKTGVNRHATKEEEELIKSALRDQDIRLYVFLAIVELAGIRPKEILALQIKDIDILSQSFVLTSGKTKTSTYRRVPIPNTLLPLLNKLNLKDVPDHYYIFSNNLLPGEKKMTRPDNIIRRRWDKIVKDQLKIDVTPYSFKGLGADKRRDAGISKETVSRGLGHTNTRTTDIYLERESERQRRALIEFTPEF
jgi:integrase